MEKKNNFMLVMIVILSISLLGAVSFIVYDKVIKKDEGTNTATKTTNNDQTNNSSGATDKTSDNVDNNKNEQANTTTYDKINFEIVKDSNSDFGEFLKINGVDYKNINGFVNVEQFADLVLIRYVGNSVDVAFQFVDKNGNIVGEVGRMGNVGVDNKYNLSVKGEFIDYTYDEVIDGNTITFRTIDAASDNIWGMCQKIVNLKNQNLPAKYLVRLTYLGDGKFAAPTILSTTSATDYENEMKLDCNKCINSGKEFSAENNCSKF